jgi:AraC-like DNA-binding protein
MKYNIIRPSAQLQNLVQCFWTLESQQDEITPKDYFLMADSCPEIIFQYNGGFKNYAMQSARMRFQHSIHNKFDVGGKVGFFGVRLQPHASSQLLNIPASELAEQVFDFSTLFKQAGENLTDQVYHSINTADRVARVSAFLTKKAAGNTTDPIKCFVDQVVNCAGRVNVSTMQRESGLSTKQFERRFKAITGFPPKYFARIVRFQSVKDKYCSNRFKTLTNLAYSCDYYDQSHFNREFKEFSGVQPLQYFKFLDQDNTILPKSQQSPVFDGYLPCGWFV